MNRFARLLLASFVLLALVAPPATAATTTEIVGGRGGTAWTVFTSTDGCLQESVVVVATTSVTRPGHDVTTYAHLVVVTDDTCTGEQTELFGVIDPVVHRQNDARVGRIVGQVELVDWATGTFAEVHEVDLTLQAVGQPEHGRGVLVQRYPGGQTVYRASGTFAEATATGSVLAPDGSDLVAGQVGTGSLDWSTSTQLVLTRWEP